MQTRPAGDRGILIELDDNSQVLALADAVRARWSDQLEEVVPGHRTLLVMWGENQPNRFEADLGTLALREREPNEQEVIRVPVVYDGPDIEFVAAAAGISPAEVAQLHSSASYTGAFAGFAPGFVYLIGGDPRLAVSRRSDPRPHVKAGAVAVAAGYSAIYPSAGPGGWHLIGRTEIQMFDLGRNPPALIEPGARVVFEVA